MNINILFYIILFILIHVSYYQGFMKPCKINDDNYKPSIVKNYPESDGYDQGNIPVDFTKGEWAYGQWYNHIYKLMKEEWVKEILTPITHECNSMCFSPYIDSSSPITLIPLDKIIIIKTLDGTNEYGEGIFRSDYYVKDDDKNKIHLDINKQNLVKSNDINPFYVVDCIAQWERYRLNELSPKCFRLPQNWGGRQLHTHSLDIIHDVIYPRYLHYKTISYNL